MDLVINKRFKDNGNAIVSFSKIRNGTVGKFKVCKSNLFLNEITNSNSYIRKFILSIRLDGAHEDEGLYKLTQIDLDRTELLELRNQIDDLLNSNGT